MISEALVVALGSGGALFTLAGALAAWIPRDRSREVAIRIIAPDGKEISVQTRGNLNAEQTALLIQQTLERSDVSADRNTHSGARATDTTPIGPSDATK